MSISLITGLPGSGKTYVSVQRALDEAESGRLLITNLAIVAQSWPGPLMFFASPSRESPAFGKAVAAKKEIDGLRAALVEADSAEVRIAVADCEASIEGGLTSDAGDGYQADGFMRHPAPDFVAGALIIVDEAQRYFPPGRVAPEFAPCVEFLQRHRHYGCDVWLCYPSSHFKGLTPQVRDMAEEFWLVENLAKKRRGLMPGLPLRCAYRFATSQSRTAMSEDYFRIKKSVYEHYKTSGGTVGAENAAESDRESRWARAWNVISVCSWILIAVFVVGAGHGCSRLKNSLFRKLQDPVVKVDGLPTELRRKLREKSVAITEDVKILQKSSLPAQIDIPTIIGYYQNASGATIFELSDGREVVELADIDGEGRYVALVSGQPEIIEPGGR